MKEVSLLSLGGHLEELYVKICANILLNSTLIYCYYLLYCCIIHNIQFYCMYCVVYILLYLPLLPGFTPLHLASGSGRTSAVQALLGKGGDPNVASHNGDTPLHLACSGGHTSTVS